MDAAGERYGIAGMIRRAKTIHQETKGYGRNGHAPYTSSKTVRNNPTRVQLYFSGTTPPYAFSTSSLGVQSGCRSLPAGLQPAPLSDTGFSPWPPPWAAVSFPAGFSRASRSSGFIQRLPPKRNHTPSHPFLDTIHRCVAGFSSCLWHTQARVACAHGMPGLHGPLESRGNNSRHGEVVGGFL